MRTTNIVLGICFAAVAACATASESGDPPTPEPALVPNPNDPAAQPGGADGGPRPDAARSPKPDASTPPDAGGPTVCAPGDTTAFLPRWIPPTAARQSTCTQTQIDAYFAACLGPASSQSACTTFRQANAACSACIATPETAPSLGPVIIRSNGLTTLNISGCIAHATGDTSPTGCAYKEQRALQCVSFACDPNCPTGTQAQMAAYQQCIADAQNVTGCSTFASDAQLCRANATGAAAQCVNQSSFVGFYNVIVPLFCGP